MITMEDLNESRFGRSDVQSYIIYLGNIISRMAENSRSCKNWLIVIISAIIAVGISMDEAIKNIWILYFPTILFKFLDCYYLGQERRFRDAQKKFVKSVRQGDDLTQSLYEVVDKEESENQKKLGNVHRALRSLISFSIWPFYGFILLAITVVLICGHFVAKC